MVRKLAALELGLWLEFRGLKRVLPFYLSTVSNVRLFASCEDSTVKSICKRAVVAWQSYTNLVIHCDLIIFVWTPTQKNQNS
ncbi:hypothetical protein V6N13_132749 [Hibiscus sabdariffa]|uniref:Uncharacterized protein n=1 Tax=Hibiscus sabdariffa TaxID=183260 RepID=A0ABR2PW82_9ROSI